MQSAKSIYEALDKEKYEVVLVGIDKQGRWLLGNASNYLLNSSDPKRISFNITEETPEVTAITKQHSTQLIPLANPNSPTNIDVFFPIIHGTYGEDGSLQGFLEMMDAAYVGAGVLGSGIGMDKDVMKRLLQTAKIPVAHFIAVKKHEVNEKALNDVVETLKFPIFVKPANTGSSVGISKARNKQELQAAIEIAFEYDTKIMFEEYIKGREIEISVLGNDEPVASVPGEIIVHHEFYSYEAKYIDENGASLAIPAKLSAEKVVEVQQLALHAYKVLECAGMARADFFFTEEGKFYLNEINTLPGFTKISMYPKLWEASGLSYPDLLGKLITLALEKRREKNKLQRNYKLI